MTIMSTLSPDKILQTGSAFWSSKTLLSAVELGVFTELARRGPTSEDALCGILGLDGRGADDFFDALVALGFLERGQDGLYRNTPETDLYLDRAKGSYIGGILEMMNARLYPFWGNLTTALRTGRAQNETSRDEPGLFDALYRDPKRLEQFLAAMTGISLPTARALATAFPWQKYRTFADIGCAQGGLTAGIASAQPHLSGIGFDLPMVRPVFESYVAKEGLAGRLTFEAGDFFNGRMPQAEVLVMGHILHDWSLDQKRHLVAEAFKALPSGGALIVYDAMIDDERRSNAFGLLMSLNMLIETEAGFDYTGAQCQRWLKEAGFVETAVTPLQGPYSMAVGYKP